MTFRPGVRGGSGRTLGYTDYLIPLHQTNNDLFFFNPKAVIGDHDDHEQNFGFGYRHLSSEEGAIYGANFFYDARKSINGFHHKQLGLGFEVLTDKVDFRVNLYNPVTDKKLLGSTTAPAFGPTTVVNQTTSTYEKPLGGFDYELGLLVPKISNVIETRIFAGGYHYDSNLSKNINGFRGRMEISPSPFLTFQLEVKNDNTSNTDFFGGGYITIPFDTNNLFKGKNPFEGIKERLRIGQGARELKERMTDPIVRDIDIVAPEVENVTVKDIFVDNIIYVDNTNDNDLQEDGSLAHPHNTLDEAFTNPRYTDDAWIYVASGDGTATGYTGLYSLRNGVTLWGEGYEAFAGLGGGTHPIIDGKGEQVTALLTLSGSNMTVQGLQIQNAETGITTVSSGTLIIRNNIITSINSVASNATGIGITTSGDTTLTIQNNTISNVTALGSGAGMVPFNTTAFVLDGTISNNIIQSVDDIGISFGILAGTTSLSLFNNVVKNSGDDGVRIVTLVVSPFNVDFGGGSLGSIGQNSIFNNAGDDIDNTSSTTINAENNYWGGGAGTFAGADPVDGVPFLTSDPN